MICPDCGHVGAPDLDDDHDASLTEVGDCESCGTVVYDQGTTKSAESSKFSTIRKGESREDLLMDTVMDELGGASEENRGRYATIDRNVYDEAGNLLYAIEIKERSCTLNAYENTKFPYVKVEKAQEIVGEEGVPVHILLIFTDTWAKLTIDETDGEYAEGDEPFAPNYRPSQKDNPRETPVLYPVEELDVLGV